MRSAACIVAAPLRPTGICETNILLPWPLSCCRFVKDQRSDCSRAQAQVFLYREAVVHHSPGPRSAPGVRGAGLGAYLPGSGCISQPRVAQRTLGDGVAHCTLGGLPRRGYTTTKGPCATPPG